MITKLLNAISVCHVYQQGIHPSELPMTANGNLLRGSVTYLFFVLSSESLSRVMCYPFNEPRANY